VSRKKSNFQKAIAAWSRAVGARHVDVQDDELRRAEAATFATSQNVSAILRPGNRDEVQDCVRIANTFRISLFPISGGKNWGYGSRVPTRSGSVLLDLGRLNKILNFDESLGYVTIQPGVTFKQLDQFLKKKRSRLYANSTGSTVDSSPLANAIERGLGRGPHADRFANTCALRVVLADGRLISTGFAGFSGAATAHLHRHGIGPSLDGLFSQSNLGVVVELTMWLAPRPRFNDELQASVKSSAALGRTIDAARSLFQSGVLRSPFKVFNEYRILSLMTRYPWGLAENKTPLSKARARMLLETVGVPPWTVSAFIGHESLADRKARRALITKSLHASCTSLRFGPTATNANHTAFRSSDDDIPATYWRKLRAPNKRLDPDADRCGVIFVAPVVPLTGKDVTAAVDIIEREAFAAKLEPMIGISVLDPRVAYVVAPIFFDRDAAGEDRRARKCADRMLSALVAKGYYPYRLGLQSMELMRMARERDSFASSLKSLLDPNRILAPGRYDGT
jgi:4-cresol dehydrogenase (hydroxylating)